MSLQQQDEDEQWPPPLPDEDNEIIEISSDSSSEDEDNEIIEISSDSSSEDREPEIINLITPPPVIDLTVSPTTPQFYPIDADELPPEWLQCNTVPVDHPPGICGEDDDDFIDIESLRTPGGSRYLPGTLRIGPGQCMSRVNYEELWERSRINPDGSIAHPFNRQPLKCGPNNFNNNQANNV